MPRIELIPEVLYTANDPYHWEVDNLPLQNILLRENLINLALDNVIAQMRDAIGTQGTVANRLNQSINADGSLKASAIDSALHTIDDHADTANFVRMTKPQSDKLGLVADQATNFGVTVFTDDTTSQDFSAGFLVLKPSATITPSLAAPNIVTLDLNFPQDAAHRHYYSLTPVPQTPSDPDFLNYQTTTASTPFVEGSLRIYINGVRISDDAEVYVPGALVDDPWTLMSFTASATAGTFTLTSVISDTDVIRIDFDIALD